MNLKNKKVVILGGSGLIGSAVVVAFKEHDAQVDNVDLTGNADIVSDIHTPYAYQAIMEEVKAIDILIDCTYPQSLLLADSWVWFIDKVAQSMAQGCIILMGSIYGSRGPDMRLYENNEVEIPKLWYSFFKGGVAATTRWIASVYAPDVRCVCIEPGGVQDNQPESFVKQYCDKTPLKRMAKPEDIAEAVIFAAMSDYITGVSIPVSGGITTRL